MLNIQKLVMSVLNLVMTASEIESIAQRATPNLMFLAYFCSPKRLKVQVL